MEMTETRHIPIARKRGGAGRMVNAGRVDVERLAVG